MGAYTREIASFPIQAAGALAAAFWIVLILSPRLSKGILTEHRASIQVGSHKPAITG